MRVGFGSVVRCAAVVGGLMVGGIGAAGATSITFADFSSTAGLTLNGSASQVGSRLELVPSSFGVAGSAFASTAIGVNAGTTFSTSFSFLVQSDANSPLGVTDGFTFLLQNVGVNALGGAGQGLGYTGLSPSVAVVFRGRAPSFIGVITGGIDPADLPNPFNPPGSASGLTEGGFYDQTEFAWIDYDGTDMSVFLSTTNVKPNTATATAVVDLDGILGSQAFVGFTAGNGGAFGSQNILSWNFRDNEAVEPIATPEPGTLAILGMGLGALTMVRRRRQG